MPAGPAQCMPVVLKLFAEESQIQIYDFAREWHQKNFSTSQFTRFVLLLNEEVLLLNEHMRGFMA